MTSEQRILDKAKSILFKMNNAKITDEEWAKASIYSKQDLKRKCFIVVDVILDNCCGANTDWRNAYESEIYCDEYFWNDVKEAIKNY